MKIERKEEKKKTLYLIYTQRVVAVYVKNDVNTLAVAKSLAYGFIPGTETIYKNIFKLKHGSYLEFDINKKKIVSSSYWKFRIKENKQFKKKEEILEEF